MSLRTELAAGLTASTAGVNVQPYYRQSAKPGDGWVSLAGFDRDETGFSYMESWEVRIVTSSDIPTAEAWIEEHADTLIDAVGEHLIVVSMAQVTFVADQGQIPGLLIVGVRPHE